MSEVYLVWDHDPMASSMGEDYIAKAYASREDAEAEANRLNEASRQRWEAAAPGREVETWNWKRARVTPLTVVEP